MGDFRDFLFGLTVASSVAVGVPSANAAAAASSSADGSLTNAEGNEGLAEIVVTATKRLEDAQKIGVSITALEAAQLEEKGVEQFFDYGTSIPNLSFGVGAGDGSLAARGIALRGVQGSNTTGFYIDDTPVIETLDPHIVDIARVEVLRGPQGTLYGADSMGGTVKIITAQPDYTSFAGQLHVTGSHTEHGSFNELVEGAVNVPLIDDTVAVRASAFYQFDDGFFDKGVGPEPGPPTSVFTDVGSMKYYGGQIAIKFTPIGGLSVTPRVMYQVTEQDGAPYAGDNPNNLLQREIFDIQEGGSDKWYLASLTVNDALSMGTIVSSTAYFDRKTFESEDDTDDLQYSLGLTTPLLSPVTRLLDQKRFVQELRFVSSFSSPLQVIGGVFYLDNRRTTDYEEIGVGLGTAVGYPTDNAFSFKGSTPSKEYAVFGDVSYNLSSSLKATVGLRWFRDSQSFTQFTDGYYYGGPATYVGPSSVDRGFTPKYLLEYQATSSVLVYASAAKGFREGGSNIALPPGPAPAGCDTDLAALGLTRSDVTTYKSDNLWSFETGIKSSMAENRVTLNLAGFLIDWNKIQQDVRLPLCGYGFLGNEGKAISSGFEVELNARPIPALTLGLGLGYDNARITNAAANSPQIVGSPVYQVPRVTIASNAEYTIALTSSWSGFSRVDWSYVGQSLSANNTQFDPLVRDAYRIANLRIGARDGHYEVTAFVKNLTNERANLSDAILLGAEVPGMPRFVVNQPLTSGIDARVRF